MLFHKPSQQAFVFPSKCGSNTVMQFLTDCGWKNLGKNYFVPEYFIGMYPNLQNYQIYAFVRDPVLRFESGILHIKQVIYSRLRFDQFLIDQGISKTRETVSYEDLIPTFSKMQEKFFATLSPQVKWHQAPNVIALNFNNMENELRRITGNTEQPLMRYNTSTNFGRSVITPAVEEFVRQQYADDYRLWNTLNGV